MRVSMGYKEASRKWILQSLHDKEMAEKNCSIEGYDVAAFLAHQVVEKLLKGIYLIEGRKSPRTHHIDELAQNLDLDENLMPDIFQLAPDYQLSRYPDIADCIPFEQYDQEMVILKINSMNRIFSALTERYQDVL